MLDSLKELIKLNKQYILENLKRRKFDIKKREINYLEEDVFGKVHTETPVYFVLSTGRSGTKLLANFFSKSYSNIVSANHELNPRFIYYEKIAYENGDTLYKELKYMFDVARFEYILKSFLYNKIFLETNNRVTFFAYIIKDLFPNAKFIHLVRNPIKFIISGVSRDWYSGKTRFDLGRITSKDKEWTSWSKIRKVAFLWNQTNLFIENFKNIINREDFLTIKSEELFSDPSYLIKIVKFLGIKKYDSKEVNKFLKKPINKQKRKKLPNYEEWSKEMKLEAKSQLDNTLLNKYSFNI